MDWDFKMPPWDVAELDRDAEPGLGSVVLGSSGCGPGDRPRAVDCSVDLKLGGLGDFVPSQNWKDQPMLSPAASSSGTSKRPRAPGNGGQRVACSVDGCKVDLSSCREYHRRHKVCEAHSKTPVVMVSGQEQRFCQQCSRFHLLVEFDEVKRSCRKRLDGHNRRRRKPQPDSMNSGNLFTCHQGTTFSAYPPIFPASTSKSNWPGIVRTEDNAVYAHCLPSHGINRNHNVSSTHSHSKQRKQFPFLQENDTTFSSSMMLGISVGQPHLRTSMPPGSSGGGSKIFSNGSAEVFDSDCALSLLSAPTQTSGINLGQVAQIPAAQPHVSSLHYGRLAPYLHLPVSDRATPAVFSCSGIEDEHRGSFLVSDVSDRFQSVFHVGGEGSSEGTSQSLPFCWQ